MFTSDQLVEGTTYTRDELRYKFDINDANLNNGVFRPAGHSSIWLFITEQKSKGRVQLNDLLDKDILYWDGQPQGRTDKLIIKHEGQGFELLVFYRKHLYEFLKAGFKYEGQFRYVSHTSSHPTHFILQRIDKILAATQKDIEALQIEESYKEGKLCSVLVNKHERNPKIRAAAVRIHGTICQTCGFSFAEIYGTHGETFIEVHHLYPVSEYKNEVDISPSKDMAVLCSNCHRMIHRNPEKPLSLEELRQIIASNRKPLKEF